MDIEKKVATVVAAGTIAAGAGAAVAYESGIFDNGDQPDSTYVQTVPATQQPTMIPGTEIPNPLKTPTIEPTPVSTASIPVPTNTPEHVITPPCEIVPQEYCKDAKLIDFEYNGQHFKVIGFKLPAGIPVFSMAEGKIFTTIASGNPFDGSYTDLIRNGSQAPITIAGDYSFEKPSQSDVTNGTKIGVMKDSGITNLGDFNLIFSPALKSPDGKGFISDDSLISQMFPEIDLSKPHSRVVTDGAGKTTYITTYNDTPPGH